MLNCPIPSVGAERECTPRQKILVALGKQELEVLEERAKDTEDFDNKRRKRVALFDALNIPLPESVALVYGVAAFFVLIAFPDLGAPEFSAE
jgi:hypothetical protein